MCSYCVYFVFIFNQFHNDMKKHRDHILTSELRKAYDYLYDIGKADDSFDVSENKPAGKNRKKSVKYNYAGRSANPFAFIVNSGERKDYHLFYLRRPGASDINVVKKFFDSDKISINPKGEITIQVHNLTDAKKTWAIVKRVQLK